MPEASDKPVSFSGDSWTTRAVGCVGRAAIRGLVRIFYPRIEVAGGERLSADGAILLVANHPNHLIDPILIGIATGRPVHFFAREPLFRAPFLGRLLRVLGFIPAYHSADDPSLVKKNLESLTIAADFLARGEPVGVFPEGESHDALKVEKVHTSAARLSIQAVTAGCHDLRIVPVGLNYERKEQFRSAVWVRLGEPFAAKDWLETQVSDNTQPVRALTEEIGRRLRQVVIHLAEERWEPFLGDLEVLLPFARNQMADPVKALRQRKRIADAINHFTTAEPERAQRMAESIESLRQRVADAGLELRSPVLRHRGPRFLPILLWQTFRLLLGLLPVLLGVLHHLVPYLATRAAGVVLQRQGRTREALVWLGVGLPVFSAWYGLVWWWIVRMDYVVEVAWTWTLLMPFCGLLAVRQGRRALEAGRLWQHQLGLLVSRARLQDLRRETAAVAMQLKQFMARYRELNPAGAAPEAPFPWRWLAGRVVLWTATATVALAGIVWVESYTRERSLAELIYPGPDLSLVSTNLLAVQLTADETALRNILIGLDELEAKALQVQREFESGQRSYYDQADNDAVRLLLVAYVNYRAALLRLVWKYQQHERVADERLRLRAVLVQIAAGSALYESSLKLVTQFRRPETVRKLNEAEPIYGIPAGFYNTVRRNLAHTKNRRLLEEAAAHYHALQPAFAHHGLGEQAPYDLFHKAVLRSEANTPQLLEQLKTSEVKMAIADAREAGDATLYRARSFVSAWVGDAKIRQPRDGESLIGPAQVEQLRANLKPGDIVIERRNWFLSNAFLPGFWPHAVLYVGTPQDLRRLQLDQDPRVQRHWAEFIQRDEQGHEHVIVEAVSEGVIFASLEHSIGGGDAAAVMRPRLGPEQIREAIARAFSHAGKPYDFEFDFFSTDKLVCTELVFRAYDGAIDFPLIEVLGRKTMPALELVRKCCDERGRPEAQLEFISFLDGDERRGTAVFKDITAFEETLRRPGLDWLQKK